MKHVAKILMVVNLIAYTAVFYYIKEEADRMEFITSHMMPILAEKSYTTGCTKKPSQAKECAKKAKQYKTDLMKAVGL